ncbi:CapA family protein [Streptococcus sp. 20-1249]|uniref:CapA family protein n=1 Tax=Streptococcus hepaticus TaxID=3349163 RepID=UPI003749846B
MGRRSNRAWRHRQQRRKIKVIAVLSSLIMLVLGLFVWTLFLNRPGGVTKSAAKQQSSSQQTKSKQVTSQTARVMAHGDLLYHDGLYISAQQADGSYDFSTNFTYVKPWIEQADLAIADFEGTISSEFPLAGYPLFNAPSSVVTAIKDAGYDVVDLAHNHILDSQLSGLISTSKNFTDLGIGTVGIYPEGNRASAPLFIREINGIKIAILAYAYGFNGMEGNLTQEEYDSYLSDMNESKMQAEIERAEKEADVTIVMPQMGVEYQLEPTQEQVTLYHKMVDWGADVVFGGHPHVAEPSEILEKDGDKKLIIYSMGNFISNQRMETMEGVNNYQWTERGVLMDVTFEKKDGKTLIQTATAHPTWVSRVPNGQYAADGGSLYTYQTFILEDFIEGGKHREQLDEETKARVDTAYQEMKDFMHLSWSNE